MRLFLVQFLFQVALAGSSRITYAALGDSYAAGDGAGCSRLLPNFDIGCARFSDAYPVQVANSADLDVSVFHNLACGGAVSRTVVKTQIPRISNSDFVTIQVGGNEIDFFVLLNECVQQWWPFSTCDMELAKARGLVQSTQFIDSFDTMMAAAKRTVRPETKLLVLGYARFFNDQTEQCNRVSFSRTHASHFLMRDLRAKLNDIVVLLNNVVQGVAEAHGATYVDIDKVFEGHRFCEAGVIEPAPDASWFFNDVGRESMRAHHHGDHNAEQQILSNPFRRFLNFTTTFHPTSDGHTAIAKEVVNIIKIS